MTLLAIAGGLILGFSWMLYAASKASGPTSVWSPWIDWLSFAFGISLWFVAGLWAPFVGGAIVGVHAAQIPGVVS